MQADRRRAAEAAAETEAAAHAEASRLVLEKQLQQESDLQQVIALPLHNIPCLLSPCLHNPDLQRFTLFIHLACAKLACRLLTIDRKGLCLCCQYHRRGSNHWPLVGQPESQLSSLLLHTPGPQAPLACMHSHMQYWCSAMESTLLGISADCLCSANGACCTVGLSVLCLCREVALCHCLSSCHDVRPGNAKAT